MLSMISAWAISTLATPTDKQVTFFIWNLMVALTMSIFSCRMSLSAKAEGNLPARVSPGPRTRGICLIRMSEARKASYFWANFLINFLFLLNFFKSSMFILSTPIWSAFSQCFWLPRTHTANLALGAVGSLKVPEKRLSLWGS